MCSGSETSDFNFGTVFRFSLVERQENAVGTREDSVGTQGACHYAATEAQHFGRARKRIVMKSKLLLCWSVLGFIAATVIDASGADVQPYAIPGRYIVVLKHGHQPADVAAKHGLKTRHVFGHALHGFAGEISDARLEALRQDPRVELIEPELELFTSAQTLPTGVKRISANLSPLAKIDGLDERINADIAILDTGIAPHPDLNIYTNVSFIAGQTTDGNGHGTHVAGIAAAIDNGTGIVGVAPGARLWAIKVMDLSLIHI